MDKRTLKLRGMDDYPQSELNAYWKKYDDDISFAGILGISVSCSNKCNLRCIHCYAGEDRNTDNELTLEEQMDVITQANALGAKSVIICGDGEPTIDKNLVGIVEHANKHSMVSIVVCNGVVFGDDKQSKNIYSLSGEELIQKLFNANVSLIIKLESLEEEVYERIVGVKNTYNKFIKGIDRVLSCGFGISDVEGVTRLAFRSAIMKDNFGQLEQLKQFADTHNAQYICNITSLVGTALKNLENMFELDEYEKIRKILLDYTAKRETLMVDTPKCMVWHYGPCVGINGEIRECYTSAFALEDTVGNIRETPLRELIIRKRGKSNLNCNEFCPVKTRINNELLKKGEDKIWTCQGDKEKLKGY